MGEPRNTGNETDRRRFYATLGLFLLWVAALGAMSALSGRRPVSNPTTPERR